MEIAIILTLVGGFILARVTTIALFNYILVFLAGIVLGRFLFLEHEDSFIPVILVMIGFLVGFSVGSPVASRVMIILFFAVGSTLSYQLSKVGIPI